MKNVVVKLCAGWLVVLAISPFNAPFQTCGASHFRDKGVNDAASAIVMNTAQTFDDEDNDSVAIVLPRSCDDASRRHATWVLPSLSPLLPDVCSVTGCRHIHARLTTTDRQLSSDSILRI